ncbi:MAG: hypothetical protein N2483_09110, partial [Burkholderiaceae bacterium]|nr:hypothetical protein [Burkholderiaceae bacterium]
MTDIPGLPPARPIPLKDRAALVFVERAQLDVDDGCFVAIDEGQMGADPERGHVFTNAMLHLRGTSETLILGA